jgi:hypothetical protein
MTAIAEKNYRSEIGRAKEGLGFDGPTAQRFLLTFDMNVATLLI